MYKKYYYVSVLKIIYLIVVFIIALNPDEESLFSKNEYLFVVILNAIFIFFLAEKLHKIKFQTFIQYLQLKLYKYNNKLKWLTVSLNHLIFIVFLFLSSAVSLFAYFSFKLGLSIVFPRYSDNSNEHTNVIIFSIFLVGLSLALLYLILIFFNVFTDDVILCKTDNYTQLKSTQKLLNPNKSKKENNNLFRYTKDNLKEKVFKKIAVIIILISVIGTLVFYFINKSQYQESHNSINSILKNELINYSKQLEKYKKDSINYELYGRKEWWHYNNISIEPDPIPVAPIAPSINTVQEQNGIYDSYFWMISLKRNPNLNILPVFFTSFFYLLSIAFLCFYFGNIKNKGKKYRKEYSKEFIILAISSSIIFSFTVTNYFSRLFLYLNLSYLFRNIYCYFFLATSVFYFSFSLFPKINSVINKNHSLFLSNKGVNRIVLLIWFVFSLANEIYYIYLKLAYDLSWENDYSNVYEYVIRDVFYDDKIKYVGLVFFLGIPIIYFVISWIVNGFKENKRRISK